MVGVLLVLFERGHCGGSNGKGINEGDRDNSSISDDGDNINDAIC